MSDQRSISTESASVKESPSTSTQRHTPPCHLHLAPSLPSSSYPDLPPSCTCTCHLKGHHNQQDTNIGRKKKAAHDLDSSHLERKKSHNSNHRQPQQQQGLNMSKEDIMEVTDESGQAIDLSAEVARLKELIRRRDQEIIELKSHLDKYQAIFSFTGVPSPLLPSPLSPRGPLSAKKRTRTRLFGISAEPADSTSAGSYTIEPVKPYPKDEKTKSLLESAIQSNEFMKHLDGGQIAALTSCMTPVIFPVGSIVIKEGDPGNVIYIVESGILEVYNETVSGRRLTRGALFGELALLYNCTRTASVRVLTADELAKEGFYGPGDAHLWALERTAFQAVMVERGLRKRSQVFNFLREVQLFSNWNEESLSKVVDVSEEKTYKPGDYIIREGNRGDTFFVIQRGYVRVTKNQPSGEEKFLRQLKKGDFFGEKALTASSPDTSTAGEKIALRTANVIAESSPDSSDISCLVIDRDAFHQLISNKVEAFERPDLTVTELKADKSESPFDRISLDDLHKIATLGVGGFGRVELVTFKKKLSDEVKSFALKVMKKKQIMETRQQTHILSEKNIMAECNSPFIVRLFTTFKDQINLYMLMEVCLGGELWTLLRDRGHFDEDMTRFYVGCVCVAFEYLHSRSIIYRDLKPENMLLDQHGYVKLTDFGFAKKLMPAGRKTWTFCGTPEYVAPEIILNKGHDYAADYWSLGVLMFELLTGAPPFSGQDPMKTYNIILKGIEAIDFPRFISKDANILIKRLCKETPSERLGYMRGGITEIKSNRWFDGFHWEGLEKRTMRAPYIPTIRSALDVTNFDQYPAEDPDSAVIDPSFDSGWDAGF